MPGDRLLKRTQTVFPKDLHQRSTYKVAVFFWYLFLSDKKSTPLLFFQKGKVNESAKRYTFAAFLSEKAKNLRKTSFSEIFHVF
jgi:hypothetical protein